MPVSGTRQHLRQENALIDFDAVLLALHQLAFGIDLLARRRQARHQLRRVIRKIIDAHEFAEIFGELAIDSFGVAL